MSIKQKSRSQAAISALHRPITNINEAFQYRYLAGTMAPLSPGVNMRRHASTGIALLVLSHLAFANVSSAQAQAGSVGGTIGKQDKSISGGEEADRSPTAPHSRRPAAKAQETSGHSCRSIAGTWSSWASGQLGPNDTRFNADGTITHPASKGTWSCESGQYVHVWSAFGRRGPYRLSANGKQLIKIEDGSVSFFRGGAAPHARN